VLLAADLHLGRSAEADLDRFLAAALDEPDRLVVLAGDLLDRPGGELLLQADLLVQELLLAGVRLVLVVGNHDLGGWLGERAGTKGRKLFGKLLGHVLEQPEVVAHRGFDSIAVIDDDVFVSLRSSHRGQRRRLRVGGVNRIRGEQIEWARDVLVRIDTAGKRLHLVTHRSLWHDSGDQHSAMRRRRRLETELLAPCGFDSFISGHQHRFVHDEAARTPKTGFKIRRIGLPALSCGVRSGHAGFVQWRPPGEEPVLVPT